MPTLYIYIIIYAGTPTSTTADKIDILPLADSYNNIVRTHYEGAKNSEKNTNRHYNYIHI